jgi:hypothetical protein
MKPAPCRGIAGLWCTGFEMGSRKGLEGGETFYEPTGCLHRVSKNPAEKGKTRVLAVVLHPRDAKQIAILEAKKE